MKSTPQEKRAITIEIKELTQHLKDIKESAESQSYTEKYKQSGLFYYLGDLYHTNEFEAIKTKINWLMRQRFKMNHKS